MSPKLSLANTVAGFALAKDQSTISPEQSEKDLRLAISWSLHMSSWTASDCILLICRDQKKSR
jgi:hypothetical protein